MSTSNNLRQVNQMLNRNSPAILTAIGITGTIATAYLAAKASFKAARIVDNAEAEIYHSEDPVERSKTRFKLVWQEYIPTVACGVGTVSAIALASRVESRRTAAAVSAYSISERAFSEYKKKVVDTIGAHKEQVVRDDIVRDQMVDNQPKTNVIIGGSGPVLCCELTTKRYFMSDMETLRKAMNDINQEIMNNLYVTLDEFYDLVGLEHTKHSNELGWDSESGNMKLEITTTMSPDGRPCIAFEYSYLKPI